MKNEIIESYTWNILKKQLQKAKISNTALYNIIDNVKEQLYSILYNFKDEEFRNAILIVGSEEGTFYEPKNILVANMVVVAIRNSLLEGVSSKSYKQYGSNTYLSDFSIKEITKSAIEYFSKIDLFELSNLLILDESKDVYRNISNKYPTAMKALIELSKCSESNLEHDYKKLKTKPFELEELNNVLTDEIKKTVYESGIDSTFNDTLCNLLLEIKNNDSQLFFIDSFKMCTRNYEKLLKILEFVLTHDAYFLTNNYFISNTYVSRRKKLLKASHTTKEAFKKVSSLYEVSNKYKKLLEEISKLYS